MKKILKTFLKAIQYGNNIMNDEKKNWKKNWKKIGKI